MARSVLNACRGQSRGILVRVVVRDREDRRRGYAALAAQWALQVEAYRESVASFQRVVQLRSRGRRATGREPKTVARPTTAPRRPARPDFSSPAHPSDHRRTVVLPPGPSHPPEATVLTRRQREIAALIANGLTNAQIASELVLTRGTVANHVEHIMNRLGFHRRAQIAVWAVERGLVQPRSD
jgi:DNA-binding NarL/FixJ family response regulator